MQNSTVYYVKVYIFVKLHEYFSLKNHFEMKRKSAFKHAYTDRQKYQNILICNMYVNLFI